MTIHEARSTTEAVWRIESARIIGALTRILGDVGRAEDFAQDAFLSALETWPESGVPGNPGAWLMTAAERRAIDHLRRTRRLDRKHEELANELELRREIEASDPEVRLGDPVGDDVLRLIFLCCHPVLSTEARVALTLRLPGGLTTAEIARAFLVPVSTLAQRVVRAKRTLREARAPFELPGEDELAERRSSVLEVIYLIFNEGYAATSGRVLPFAGRRSVSAGSWRASLRASRRFAASCRSWRSRPRGYGPGSVRPVSRSSSWSRTGPSGTSC